MAGIHQFPVEIECRGFVGDLMPVTTTGCDTASEDLAPYADC